MTERVFEAFDAARFAREPKFSRLSVIGENHEISLFPARLRLKRLFEFQSAV
jgi:hypothetical protein